MLSFKEKVIAISLVLAACVVTALVALHEPSEEDQALGTTQLNVTARSLVVDGVSNANQATTNTPPTYVIPFGNAGFRHGTIDFENMGGMSFVLEASNDDPATTTHYWADVTTSLTGGATITTNGMRAIDTDYVVGRFRLRGTTSTLSSTWTIRAFTSN